MLLILNLMLPSATFPKRGWYANYIYFEVALATIPHVMFTYLN